MAFINGGETVKGGFYWNMGNWDATFVEGERGVLPGTADDTFRRIPVVAALLAMPIMGALFVMFLPFIGIVLLAQQAGLAGVALAGRGVERVMMAMSPSWQPGMAYFAGRKRNGTKTDEAAPDTLDALEKEIDERRKQ